MERSVIANAAAIAINTVAGKGKATVSQSADGVYTVRPSPEQVPALRAEFERAMAGKPSVTVDVKAIVAPYIIRKALPWVAGSLATAFAIGYLVKGRKKVSRG